MSGIIGANVNLTESALGATTAGLGDRYTDGSGKGWLYVRANGAVTGAGYVVTIDETYDAAMVTTTNAAIGDLIGVANSAFADNDYGWVQISGPASIRVAASVAANAVLNATATAGQLNDGGLAGALTINGLALTTVNGGDAGNAPGLLNFPSIGVDASGADSFTAIAAGDASLDITGLAAAQGGAIAITGGTSSTSGNAGGAVTATGGTPGATGVGGAFLGVGGVGGATSGAGGTSKIIGGAGTLNANGGTAAVEGGAGQGTGNGAIGRVVGGASGAGATGDGGTARVTGGASLATAGNGGDVIIAGGLGTTTGVGGNVTLTGGATGTGAAGVVISKSVLARKQGAPTAKTVTAVLSAAELLTGIITTTGVTGPSIHQLPTGEAIDDVISLGTDDSFDFHVINTGTGASDDATLTTNTGLTLVGNMTVGSLTDATIITGSGHFRARRTAADTYSIYRIA